MEALETLTYTSEKLRKHHPDRFESYQKLLKVLEASKYASEKLKKQYPGRFETFLREDLKASSAKL